MKGLIILLPIFSVVYSTADQQQQCDKDDIQCRSSTGSHVVDEAAYAAYKFKKLTSRQDFRIHKELDLIDHIKQGDPRGALKMLEDLLKEHPDSPRALSSLARVYRILYNNLSEEYKRVGREEYLSKMMQIVIKTIKLDSELVPIGLLESVADFGIANSIAIGEREQTISIARELVFGKRSKDFTEEDQEFHFQTLIDETFLSGDLAGAKDMILKRSMDGETVPSLSMRFLIGLIIRLQEKSSNDNNPFRRYNEAMMNQTMPQTIAERDEILMYSRDLEKEMRRAGLEEELINMFDFLVELKVYPSRYQRTLVNVNGLASQPVWELGETGYQDKLRELEANWETIRDEALALIEQTPLQNITMGEEDIEDTKRWKQFIFHGFGTESFPDHICQITPTTCTLLKDYEFATKCPLGTIKFSKIEAGAHLKPHVGGHNFKLRAHLPLVVPALKGEEKREMARMRIGANHDLVWEEGKMLVFDDSYEHEVWNETSNPRIILIIDLVHPDITQEQFTELEHMYTFRDEGAESGPVAHINIAADSKLITPM